MPLLPFVFTARISEALMHTGFIYLPFIASLLLIVAFLYVLSKFKDEVVSSQSAFRSSSTCIVINFFNGNNKRRC